MKTAQEIQNSLAHFYGSDEFFRHGNSILTQGIQWLTENADCYWLIDLINSHQLSPNVRREPFQVFKLIKNKTGSGAKVTIEDGNNNVVGSQSISFTDFPLQSITIWRENNVIMLPSER
jgi:hypothetical protein